MLSPGKILLTICIIVGVMLFYRWKNARRNLGGGKTKPTIPPAIDLQECAICGNYVNMESSRCERADCPRK